MDKASILEDAIKYLKELQQHVKALEEEVATKTVESIVVVKKSQLVTDDGMSSSSDENSCNQIDKQLSLPEIEARVSGKCVLIKIHSEKRNGFISKMIGEIEKLNLTVVNSCVLPFGSSILDVTILAQVIIPITIVSSNFFPDFNTILQQTKIKLYFTPSNKKKILQMDVGFNLKMGDLVRNLRQSLLDLM